MAIFNPTHPFETPRVTLSCFLIRRYLYSCFKLSDDIVTDLHAIKSSYSYRWNFI